MLDVGASPARESPSCPVAGAGVAGAAEAGTAAPTHAFLDPDGGEKTATLTAGDLPEVTVARPVDVPERDIRSGETLGTTQTFVLTYYQLDAKAFDPDGKPVVGELGELVITAPMPSMPVRLWADDDGDKLRSTYFDRWPGMWRHGDWISFAGDGSCVVTGRSVATLNRGGVRLGTAEFHRVVEEMPEVRDSSATSLSYSGSQ